MDREIEIRNREAAIRAAMRKVIDDDGRVWLMPTNESTRLAEDPIKRQEKMERLRQLADATRAERQATRAELAELKARRDRRTRPIGYQADLF